MGADKASAAANANTLALPESCFFMSIYLFSLRFGLRHPSRASSP
jgi:hypothetical protein